MISMTTRLIGNRRTLLTHGPQLVQLTTNCSTTFNSLCKASNTTLESVLAMISASVHIHKLHASCLQLFRLSQTPQQDCLLINHRSQFNGSHQVMMVVHQSPDTKSFGTKVAKVMSLQKWLAPLQLY